MNNFIVRQVCKDPKTLLCVYLNDCACFSKVLVGSGEEAKLLPFLFGLQCGYTVSIFVF